QSLSKPLQHILCSMSEYGKGNRNARVHLRYHDEIGRLGAMFNSMVESNNRLIDEQYLLTIRKQEAELTALSVQINPHFIYNTLNMIQWAALDSGIEDVAQMAYYTGQIFRLTLSNGRSFISLAQEINLLACYFQIQQMRFKDRIAYELACSPELSDLKIPKLMIQPLVENCITHGVDAEHPHIDIRVHICASGAGRLAISVSDNGIGIPPETLALLPDQTESAGTRCFGSRYALKNIHQRLRLFYGEGNYVFSFSSRVGQGTTVLIDIPDHAAGEFSEKEENSHAEADCRR
ncbi:MAG: sensor histidine kinase, partial [Clostridia bacterium]|nr:sensor histidine kinase [Clostridia bacterium]